MPRPPIGLFAGIHLGWEMHARMGGSWDILNMNSEQGKAKWLAKEKLEEMPHKSDSNYHKDVALSLSSLPLCLSTHTVLFPPNKHFVSLLSISVRILFTQSQRARALSAISWPQSGQNTNLASSHCRLRPPKINTTVNLWTDLTYTHHYIVRYSGCPGHEEYPAIRAPSMELLNQEARGYGRANILAKFYWPLNGTKVRFLPKRWPPMQISQKLYKQF